MEEKIINNIKSLGIDMIDQAGSGHPGIVLGAAPILYTLFTKHLNINVNDKNWLNRDRFIMSAGHGSALLYSTLFMAGYLSLEDLKKFRQIDSITPGHPEYGVTPGVEMSTGPLGQGIASSVGFALAEKILGSRFQTSKKEPLFQYYTYVLCGDGDLMEGISYEAASLAGTLELNHLIVLYDSNQISLDGKTEFVFHENVRGRFEALGWNTELVSDGTSVKEIDQAIKKAKSSKKPTLIEIKTIIGKDSQKEGTNEVHGKPLEKTDKEELKLKWNFPSDPFYLVPNAQAEFQKELQEHMLKSYQEWAERYRDYVNLKGAESLEYLMKEQPMPNVLELPIQLETEKKTSTRAFNGEVMREISKVLPNFITGSADLFSSVKNYIRDGEDITRESFKGKNIWFGVREHAMGAILNGLALSHFLPSGSTFLAFSDYVKPAMRMSSLMNLPVTYLFSHDSISIGSDGPTHQPVEQLSTLRSMPNMKVYRPCDGKELIGCWNAILKERKPCSLILSKQEQDLLERTSSIEVERGAYIIRKEESLQGIIIATGDEVFTANRLANIMYQKYKLDLRVVSMPCMETFKEQPKEYQENLLPKGVRTVVIEAGSSFGWESFVYSSDYLFTIDHFGASGSKDQILKKFQYDSDSLEERLTKLFL